MQNRKVKLVSTPGSSSVGRVRGLGPWGRRFESCLPDKNIWVWSHPRPAPPNRALSRSKNLLRLKVRLCGVQVRALRPRIYLKKVFTLRINAEVFTLTPPCGGSAGLVERLNGSLPRSRNGFDPRIPLKVLVLFYKITQKFWKEE